MNVRYKDALVSFKDQGAGDAVVLIHGYTQSSSVWDFFVEHLIDSFRVITIDLPGHGESECIGEIHPMEQMGEVIKFVLDHLNVNEAVIIGHSMGGYIALSMARVYPKLFRGLGLFHSTSLADSEESKASREKSIKLIREDHQAFLFNFIPELFAPENRERLAPEIDALIVAAKKMTKKAVLAAQEGMKSRSSTLDVLINAKFPVMFIAGQKDSRVPFENIWVQMALTEEAHSLILRNVGHMGFLEAKHQTFDFTRAFIQSCFRLR
ncbi:MAG: alpha/beta hydrolase [Bacteroides sp.]|jgi:pimeloyl-ACP methyl ester carboxylesterase|nr:alpha/beta hydrolase [Bacteroides sp.]